MNPHVWRGLLLAGVVAVLAWSGVAPRDRFVWFLEVLPVFLGLAALLLTFRRFPLTSLAYTLIAAHMVILAVGGHYTYAEMPLFNALRDTFGLARNHYDRVGHVFQGFEPAIVAREILLRLQVVRGRGWVAFLSVCVCLALSAFYELLEWWVAVASGSAAVAFLATQGDVWDTQWDMFLALCGAMAALALLGRLHDRQLARLGGRPDTIGGCTNWTNSSPRTASWPASSPATACVPSSSRWPVRWPPPFRTGRCW